MKKHQLLRTVATVVGNVILVLFLLICALAVTVTVLAKRDADGTAELFGYQMRIVTSGSMEESEWTDVSDYEIKSLPVGTMIFVQTVPEDAEAAETWYSELEVGDVLTFRYVYGEATTITHRVTSITETPTDGYLIRLAGDNKTSATNVMTETVDTSDKGSGNYVIGKVVAQNYLFGRLCSLLQNPVGIIWIILVPCLFIILFEAVKLIRLGQEEKKRKKAELETAQQEIEQLKHAQDELNETKKEIEELKQRLADLESTTPTNTEEEEP